MLSTKRVSANNECERLATPRRATSIVAKRVEHVPHSDPTKIVIKSINPEYQTYEREAEEVNIVGRVIWAAKRL